MHRPLRPLPSLALRFAVVTLLLLGAGSRYATAIVEPLVPVMGRAVDALTPAFDILGVALDRDDARPRVVFRANLSKVLLVGRRFAYPMGYGSSPAGWYQVYLTTGGILQHALFLLIIVLAWPAAWRELGLRMLLALPAAMLLMLQHVVVTVLAELWFPLHDLAPGEFWPLLAWSRFLMGGGGLVVAMALAVLVIAATGAVTRAQAACATSRRRRRARAPSEIRPLANIQAAAGSGTCETETG